VWNYYFFQILNTVFLDLENFFQYGTGKWHWQVSICCWILCAHLNVKTAESCVLPEELCSVAVCDRLLCAVNRHVFWQFVNVVDVFDVIDGYFWMYVKLEHFEVWGLIWHESYILSHFLESQVEGLIFKQMVYMYIGKRLAICHAVGFSNHCQQPIGRELVELCSNLVTSTIKLAVN